MASAIAHAALPLVVLAGSTEPHPQRRRLMIVAAVVAVLPDLDLLSAIFEVRAHEPLGHRGLAHSLVIAVLVGLAAALAFFRDWRRAAPVLVAAAASHGVLDAFTTGEVGVALFAPLSDVRVSSPWKLLPSVGASQFFGAWGLFTIANELLFLLLPLGIFFAWRRAKVEERSRVLRAAVIWAVLAVALRVAMPEYFAPTVPRFVRGIRAKERDPDELPHADLPEGRIVKRWDELEARGLLGRDLAPALPVWSSSFFPSWFGGEGGRWTEPRPVLVWRTLVGFAPPVESEAKQWAVAASSGDPAARTRLFTLAPTEKLDIAFGRLDFPATKQALSVSHNVKGTPAYWSGRCNGAASAAMKHPEPFRIVDVIGKDGSHILFHPNDVKALLATAYYDTESEIGFGESCHEVSFDAGSECSMNPALFVIALANRIGIAGGSFLIDALPTIAKQYYPVAKARIDVLRKPYAANAADVDPAMRDRVQSFVDVAIDLVSSSTTVSYPKTNRRDEKDASGTRYRRVGLVPVVMRFTATIGLDARGELIAGRWTGDPADGPDTLYVVDGPPRLNADGTLAAADTIPWRFVQDLARASVDERAAMPTIDLR